MHRTIRSLGFPVLRKKRQAKGMTSANPLLSSDERQILLSLIDRIESECCANNESAASSDSSPSRSSTETISLSHNCRRQRRNVSRANSCAYCLPDSYRPALTTHNDESKLTTKTYGSALLSAPDMLSYDSNLQSVVASVSTVQATDTAGLKSREEKPQKPHQSLLSENYASSINEKVDGLPRKRRAGRAKRRRVRAANDSQSTWKQELFSQFLCSGLSEEDQRENLLCLLRAAKNRSFCIRGDQRKKFIDLQLAAKRREAPVRVNRTTQLRMQQVDDARQWERNQANWLNRHLSTGYQRQQQLQRRRQLKKQREEQQEKNWWQPVQRNRNAALTGRTHSLSTVTSPSPSLDKEETVHRRRRRRKSNSVDSSDTDISLTSLTLALGDIRAQSSANERQRRQKKGQHKPPPKKAAAPIPPTSVAVVATASGTSTATTMTATRSTIATTTTTATSTTATTLSTSTSLEDCDEVEDALSISGEPTVFEPHKKIERLVLYANGSEAKGKNLDKFRGDINNKISSSSTNASDLNTPPTPKPRLHRRGVERGKKTPDFDVLQRRMAERQRETNNLAEIDPLTTSPVSTEALEKLREDFLQSVDLHLFGSACGSSNKSVASGDSIDAGSSKDSIGGRLYSEFSHLKTDLGDLLELKKMTLKADLSPATQTELLNENQQQLSAKVRQLDSLIQRVKAHLDTQSESNTTSEGPQRKAAGETLSAVEHHDEAEMVAEALNNAKQKFAQMIGLDMSTNAASEMSSIYRTENSEHKKCLKLIETSGEEPLPSSWSRACRHENVVSFKCTSPLHNQTISSDTAININAPSNCQHDQQPKEQCAKDLSDEVCDSEDFNDCERQAMLLKPSDKDAHATRIVNQMRQQFNIMRNVGGRIKSLGDPLATLDRCRRASRQRAIERDPSEARLIPLILRYRKWAPGTAQFLAFQSNRCNWCKRYRDAVLPLWTKTIRVDLSLREPIGQSLLLLTVRLGKPLSPDWVLSTNAFPDDSCPGKAAIIDLLKTPQQVGLKPWQTVFISETDMTSRLTNAAELARVKLRAARNIAASRSVAVDDGSPQVKSSDIGTMMASPAYVSPTSLDAGTVTVCAKPAVLVGERVAATVAPGLLSASVSVEEKKSEEPSFSSTSKLSSAANVNTYGSIKAGKCGSIASRSDGVRVSGDISNGDCPSAPHTLSSLNTSSIAGDCVCGQRPQLARNYANMSDSNHHHHAAIPCGCPTMTNGGIYTMDKVPEDSEPSGCTASLQSSVH